ncbi:MAG: SdrD B-like domain-containing protein [Halanaerobiales bacterium]|nr:SdrD B-like domain-containing protein [Halanaerobiales bacterium]
MKKILIIILLLLIIFSSVYAVAQEFDLKSDEIDIESSIVLLNFYKEGKVTKSNYFFEILNFEEEEYILLPVNLLSNQIDLVVIFDRTSNLLTVKNPENEKDVKIDLTEKRYLNFSEWNTEQPIIYNNDFYISEKIIAYLLDSEIEWRPRNQEVAIIGDFEQEDSQLNSTDEDQKENLITENKENIYSSDNIFSIGSINYKVTLDYRDSNYYDSLSFKEVFSIFGRANNWALSLREEAEIDLDNNVYEIDIPFIKAQYRDENKLIILGDTQFSFNNTIGENTLRGFYFRHPDRLSVKIIPMINISGEDEPGSQIKLYVNNTFRKSDTIGKGGKYFFEDVVLNLKVLNIIKIVILTPNGETKVVNKKITAVEKLLHEGTKELEVLGGLYKKESTNIDYDGLLTGLKGGIALNKDLSLNIEASYFDKSYMDEDEKYISSNIGMAYRLIDNTILTIDWFYGDYDGLDEEGYKLNLHYAFNRGYIDGYYFHIPENLSKLISENSGEQKIIAGIYNLNEKWSIEPRFGTFETLDISTPFKNKYLRIKLRRTNGWENYFALMGSNENIEKDYSINVGDSNYILPGINERIGAGFEFRRYREGFKIIGNTHVYNNNITLDSQLDLNYQDIDYSIDFYKRILNDLLLSGRMETEYEDHSGIKYNQDTEKELRLKYNIFNNTFLSLQGKESDIETQNIKEKRYNITLNSYLTDNINLVGQYSRINTGEVFNYEEYKINTGYSYNNNLGYVNIFANYVIPEDNTYSNQISYGIGYSKIFNNESELDINLGKSYESVLGNDHEYYFTVSFAQAFAFTKNKTLNTRFNNSEHRSFVAGYVYLDENNNGIFDKGEEILPDIEMRLDNITVISNEDGLYRFNPLFADVYTLNFNFRNLYADYTPVTEEKFIRVKENENIFLNFGLTLNGSIAGKIFLDKNNNGIQDPEDEAMSWVGVTLDGTKYDYTDSRGEFYFENVSLGAHKIEIVNESIPAVLNISGDKIKHIYITKDDLDIRDIVIPLHYNF